MANNVSRTCNATPVTEIGIVAIVPAIEVLVNAFVIVAAIRGRRKLRNNSVYIYVVSLLSANVMFGIFSFYAFLSKASPFEHGGWLVTDGAPILRINNSVPFHITVKTWWGFRSAYQTTLFLTMSANVSALIYGLQKSSYFIGAGGSSGREKQQRDSVKKKRMKALCTTAISWLIPLIISIVAGTKWNCLHLCTCFDAYYETQWMCQGDVHRECSRVFETASNSFIATVFAIWLLLAVILFAIMFTTFRKYKETVRFRKASAVQSISYPPETATSPVTETTTPSEALEENVFASPKRKRPQPNLKRAHSLHLVKVPVISHNVKAMLILSILFIICSSPSMLISLVDFATHDYVLNLTAVLFSIATVYIYCVASPLVLVYYMYGLRYAVINLLEFLSCCTKTTLVRGSVSSQKHSTGKS